jgi:glutamate-1-semialdehyde 2,1-aminomutase
VIPGGVNSPVRSFAAVGGEPPFIAEGKGSHITDADGNEYIDYVGSWGPLILGHNQPEILHAVVTAAAKGLGVGTATAGEVELAERIVRLVPSAEKVRLTCSGTEAVMSAVRLARAYTGREKILKFEGCYHGHSDAMLVSAGSGVLGKDVITGKDLSKPVRGAGVTEGTAKDTILASFNDLSSVERAFELYGREIAAVITELVPANMGVILPQEDFLRRLAEICRDHGALFIADEVITGFRLGLGGAAGLFGLSPDLLTFGKIIGGGLPVGAFGGKREIMDLLAPDGDVYQAGTLSGNPVAVAAGNAQLRVLEEHPEVYLQIEARAKRLAGGLQEILAAEQYPASVNQVGSLFTLFFAKGPVQNYTEARSADLSAFAQWFHGMLSRGIYLAPSQFEAGFLSYAHSDEDIARTLTSAETVLRESKKTGEVQNGGESKCIKH